MPRVSDPAKQLENTISRLREKRRSLAAELARIEGIFEKYGIQLPERGRPGRPPGRGRPGRPAGAMPGRRGRRRKRGRFAKSGHVSIIDFVTAKGGKGATTAEVNEHRKAEGRAGNAYVTLGQLTKQKKLKRKNLKGERGSRYTVA